MEANLSFSQVFHAISRNKNIKAEETLLYSEVFNLAKNEGYCWATNKTLAEYRNLSVTAISLKLKKLQDAGLIRMTYHNKPKGRGKLRRIYITEQDFLVAALSDNTYKKITGQNKPFRDVKHNRPTQTPTQPITSISAQVKAAMGEYLQTFQEQLEQVKQLIPKQEQAPTLSKPMKIPKLKNPETDKPHYLAENSKQITQEIVDETMQKSDDHFKQTVCGRGQYAESATTAVFEEFKPSTTLSRLNDISKREKEKKAISWMLLASLFNFEELTSRFKGKETAKSLLECIDYWNKRGVIRTPEQWRMSVLVWLDQEKLLCSKSESTVTYNANRIIELCREEYRQATKVKHVGPKVDEAFEQMEAARLARKANKLQTA